MPFHRLRNLFLISSHLLSIKDRKTKSAVERQLSIIGEAVKNIKQIDTNELINYHSNIISFRNLLVHSYDSVNDEMVWNTIKKYLPSLKEEVAEKLKE
jgi:uncharacterized protein with HEPN domain